jgi:uridylate kinase
VLVKLSGEALAAPDGYWLYAQTLASLAADLAETTKAGLEIAVVIGGGNIIRGARMAQAGWIDRPTADSMPVYRPAPCRPCRCPPSARPMPASRLCIIWTAARWL